MARVVIFAALFAILVEPTSAQTTGTLRIHVSVADAAGRATPIPRHALLISDNPATAAPRRVVTGIDGTIDVRLRPGNYTVESDQPLSFLGKGYEWIETIDVVGGNEVTLELTGGNANTVAATTSVPAPDQPQRVDLSALLSQWNDSLVRIWTATSPASGFVIDAKGLIATNRHALRDATSVEVQVAPDLKVAARVLVAGADRDVAVLWVDSGAVAGVRPLPAACSEPPPPLGKDDEVAALGLPGRTQNDHLESGFVRSIDAHRIEADIRLDSGAMGGPVFASDGRIVGLTSPITDEKGPRRGETRVVPIAVVCDAISSAAQKMQGAKAPDAARLPVEPVRPFPPAALKEQATRRAGNSNAYQMSTSDFTVSFITPFMVYAAADPDRRTTSMETRASSFEQARLPSATEFANWSGYTENVLPVLLVRVTPKLSENFWTTVARGAAMTQGMAIPAIKRLKSDLAQLRVFCGETEITPIHPFALETEVASGETIHEGLYVFDPGGIGPHCGAVKLTLYSVKDTRRGESRTVEPAVVKQIWQDFEPYRNQM